MILFRCATFYQLLNAINIKKNLLNDQEADLILSDSTDLSQVYEPLVASHLFKSVIQINDLQYRKAYESLQAKDRYKLPQKPDFLTSALPLDKEYSDFYICVDEPLNKLYYYKMVQKGMHPKVHILEDGQATYVLDVVQRNLSDGMGHSYYGKKQFVDNIEEILLYKPELYCGAEGIQTKKIPAINIHNEEHKRFYLSAFETNSLPQEDYIFFEEGFTFWKALATDIDLVEKIVVMVGKDNLIVKMHPVNNHDRYTPRGIRKMDKTKVPWEMTLLSGSYQPNLKNKVYISASSTAAITSGLVFDIPFTAIFLYDLMTIGKNLPVVQPKFKIYMEKLLEHFNRDRQQIFRPNNEKQFREVIKYVSGRCLIESEA